MTPRTIYVKVSTEMLAYFSAWSVPLEVKVEQLPDDTYEMIFRAPPEAEDASS